MKLVTICAFVLVSVIARPAESQTAFEEWSTLESSRNLARLHAEIHLGQLPSDPAPLVLRHPVRQFTDALGRQIIVGQVDNVSQTAIVFPRVEATFVDWSGRVLGIAGAQVFCPAMARLAATHAMVDVIPAGGTGFFKIWSDEQSSSIARVTLDITAYFAKNGLNRVFSDATVTAPPSGPSTTVAGTLRNGGPLTIYRSVAAAAGFRDGAIYDVAISAPSGSPVHDGCGPISLTGVAAGEETPVLFHFQDAVDRLGSTAVLREEIGAFPTSLSVADDGGEIPVTIIRKCGWSGSTQAGWVRGNETTTPSGLYHASLIVDPNPIAATRSTTATFSDIVVPVTQQAVGTCRYMFDPRVVVPAGGSTAYVTVQTPAGCSWNVRQDAVQSQWISVTPHAAVGTDVFVIEIKANPQAAPRRQMFAVLGQSVDVLQAGRVNGGWFNAWFGTSLGLLFQHDDGRLFAWASMGPFDGFERVMYPQSIADPAWKVAGTGDFNADAHSDILWQRSDGQLMVWLMEDGDLLEERPLSPSVVTDPGWKVSCVGDLDRDGQADLIWQHQDGRVATWLMDGVVLRDGSLLNPGQVTDLDWRIAGCGDFNRDGWLDLIWRNGRDGRVAAWFMNSSTLVDGRAFATVADTGWRLGGVGDLDDDGSPDLFWHHTDGRVGVWLMDGLTLRDGSLLPLTMSDPGWRLAGPK